MRISSANRSARWVVWNSRERISIVTSQRPPRVLFELDEVPLLSRSTVDRSSPVIAETPTKSGFWKSGHVLVVNANGKAPLTDEWTLALRPTAEFGDEPPESAVLLGIEKGIDYWAVRAEHGQELADDTNWRDLRSAGAMLNATDAGLFTTAVGLLSWHESAGFCARCGAATFPVRSGWERRCTGCGRVEYPRTDPAVICLVHDDADHVLLARQPTWPEDRFSILAGFVEMGESLEGCVRREIHEEVGLHTHGVRYLGSQPWPFPRSLMLGFSAVADREQSIQHVDGEIAEAHWIPRDHVLKALHADGDSVDGLRLPPGISIANRMLRGWAFADELASP